MFDGRVRLAALCLLGAVLLAGCSIFGGEEPAEGEDAPPLLAAIAETAPTGGATAYLAELAEAFGWEEQVTQNARLRRLTEEEAWGAVHAALLGLYYRNGFSILPAVGEGHQFARDTVVRSPLSETRLLVTQREPVRLIFLEPPQNVEIVYHQDGEPPEVFTMGEDGVITVRRSILEQYLR